MESEIKDWDLLKQTRINKAKGGTFAVSIYGRPKDDSILVVIDRNGVVTTSQIDIEDFVQLVALFVEISKEIDAIDIDFKKTGKLN